MLKLIIFVIIFIVCAFGQQSFISRGFIPLRGGRIVGGFNTTIEENPWQLSMIYYGSYQCGASLILPDVALTASHCVNNKLEENMEIRGGSSYIDNGGDLINVKKLLKHPLYVPATFQCDIALIFLKRPFRLCRNLGTIQLPTHNLKLAFGQNTTVSGWGYTREGGEVSKILQKAQIPIVPAKQCIEIYSVFGNNIITPRMFCAGYLSGGIDACQGDSGGPLIFNNKLIGVVSFGLGCARPGFPGINANVASMMIWINNNKNKKFP